MNSLAPFLLQAGITWSPTALIIAAAVILIGLLFLRFMVKTAFTLVKVAIIILIGLGAYMGFQTFL